MSITLDLPTIFRGVMWDAHWEFDAPCVLYTPFFRYGFGGNSYHLDEMVENVCIDLSMGAEPHKDFSDSELKEFKWRGWSPHNFANRIGWHREIIVEWSHIDGDQLDFGIVSRREQWGPFK